VRHSAFVRARALVCILLAHHTERSPGGSDNCRQGCSSAPAAEARHWWPAWKGLQLQSSVRVSPSDVGAGPAHRCTTRLFTMCKCHASVPKVMHRAYPARYAWFLKGRRQLRGNPRWVPGNARQCLVSVQWAGTAAAACHNPPTRSHIALLLPIPPAALTTPLDWQAAATPPRITPAPHAPPPAASASPAGAAFGAHWPPPAWETAAGWAARHTSRRPPSPSACPTGPGRLLRQGWCRLRRPSRPPGPCAAADSRTVGGRW
jgi:hypothetical protein